MNNDEKKVWRYRDMKSMPRGIEMKEFAHGDGSITFIGQYFAKGGNPGTRPKRVYRIEVVPDLGDWKAGVFEDAVRLVTLQGEVKWNVAYAALGALRGILHKRCNCTGANRMAKRKSKVESEKLKVESEKLKTEEGRA